MNVEIVESGPKRRTVDANDTETETIDAEKAAVPEKIQTRARANEIYSSFASIDLDRSKTRRTCRKLVPG